MSNHKPEPHRDLSPPGKYLFTLIFPYFDLVRPPKYFTCDEVEPSDLQGILMYLRTYSITQIKKVVRPRKTTYIFYRSKDPKIRSRSGYAGRIEIKENYDNTPAMTPEQCLFILKRRKWEKDEKKADKKEVTTNDGQTFIDISGKAHTGSYSGKAED